MSLTIGYKLSEVLRIFLIIPHGSQNRVQAEGWLSGFFNNSADRRPIRQLSLLNQGRKAAADFSHLGLTHISGRDHHISKVPDLARRLGRRRSAVQRWPGVMCASGKEWLMRLGLRSKEVE